MNGRQKLKNLTLREFITTNYRFYAIKSYHSEIPLIIFVLINGAN